MADRLTTLRYALAFKGLPFRTEWVEYPDVEALCKKIGAKPTEKKDDGRDHYTFPVIYDPNTDRVIEDSSNIARYLEKTYPDTPRLFPKGSNALQRAFEAAMGEIVNPPTFMIYIHATAANLFEPSQKYFKETRDGLFPAPEENESNWKKSEEAFKLVSSWLERNDGSGPYVMGETPSYADFIVMSRLVWAKALFGVESAEWARISSWEGGKWADYAKLFEEYEIMN